MNKVLQTDVELPDHLRTFVCGNAAFLSVSSSADHRFPEARKASARGLAQYLAAPEAQELLAHLPVPECFAAQQAPSRMYPWLHQQEVFQRCKVHWGMLAEALPCNAVDFVCSCLREAERMNLSRPSYFFDGLDHALLGHLRQVLYRMQGMPDVGANGRFLIYQHNTSVYPSSSSQLTSPLSYDTRSAEYRTFLEESFRCHTPGTGARWVSALRDERTADSSMTDNASSQYAFHG